jgi:putative redox protein
MKIEIKRVDNGVLLEAQNDTQNTFLIDGSEDIGGKNRAMRPMQLLLVALGGCTSMDVLSILYKQRQNIVHFSVEVDGEREQGVIPALYRNIHITFHFEGNIDKSKIEHAIELSMIKYCSVAKTLEPTATITTSYTLKEVQS